MKTKKVLFILFLAFLLIGSQMISQTEAKEKVRLGVLFSLTGPFSHTGQDAARGVDIATQMINERGGLLGKEVELVKGDEVDQKLAMSEAERLYIQEKVPLIIGGYISSLAYAVRGVAEKHHKIYWIPCAMGDPICEKGQKYTFRVNPPASKLGAACVDFTYDMVAPGLKIPKEKLKVAVLQEDSLYGQMTGSGAKDRIKALNVNVVSYIEYNFKTIDLSTEVTKTKAAEPDVVIQLSAGPDTLLFWRQAKAANFNMKCFIGMGPFGMADFTKSFPKDYEYVCDVGNPMERLEPSLLKPEPSADLKEFRDRYMKLHGAVPGGPASQAFAGTWLLYKHIIPLAKSFEPEAIQKAALTVDLTEKDLVAGFGAKFAPPDHAAAGANLSAFPAIMQWKDNSLDIVYPKQIASKQLLLPMPKWEERK